MDLKELYEMYEEYIEKSGYEDCMSFEEYVHYLREYVD